MSNPTSMGGARDVEKLQAVYDRLEKTPFAERSEAPRLRETTGDPDLDAKLIVQDLMRFFLLTAMERGASPEVLVYAAELFALNVVNANDCPLPVSKRLETRRRAYEYYKNSLPLVPDLPKR